MNQRRWIILVSALFFTLSGWFFWVVPPQSRPDNDVHPRVLPGEFSKSQIKEVLGNDPSLARIEVDQIERPGAESLVLDWAIHPEMQSSMERLIDQYSPDLAALVAIDASSGRVLAVVGRNRAFPLEGNPALKAAFPAASVFKIVTAAVVLEQRTLGPNSVLEYSGRDHTLFKSQVLSEPRGWRRLATLRGAFGRSINAVFGRLGVRTGAQPLISFADRFGFNSEIPAELPVDLSVSARPKDAFELAEMASGYTQDNRLSPVHGAMIAAAIANDGVMMEPYFLNSVREGGQKTIYRASPGVFRRALSPEGAHAMRALMRETVLTGTSRRSFKGFFRGKYLTLDVGGKTGSLTDDELKGKVDWFVGFAEQGSRRIAVAAITMNKMHWKVKASYLARKTFEVYFSSL